MRDKRTGRNTQHNLLALFRQSGFCRLAGYEDANDAGRFSQDPVMRVIVGRDYIDRRGAGESEKGGFETGTLTKKRNLATLSDLNGLWD